MNSLKRMLALLASIAVSTICITTFMSFQSYTLAPDNVRRGEGLTELNYFSDRHNMEDLEESEEKAASMQHITFETEESLLLPVTSGILGIKELLKKQWVKDLKNILGKVESKSAPISIVSSDYAHRYRSMLVNWIIAAKTLVDPPISNLIVFALDQKLCTKVLLNRNFNGCIYVNQRDLIVPSALADEKHRSRIAFYMIMILRLTAMRLINHWGFDVVNYDTDAILLKNPESLYYSVDSDMVASRGGGSSDFMKTWGVVICGGLFMLKSTPGTGRHKALLLSMCV